jgi:hypothetical protein
VSPPITKKFCRVASKFGVTNKWSSICDGEGGKVESKTQHAHKIKTLTNNNNKAVKEAFLCTDKLSQQTKQKHSTPTSNNNNKTMTFSGRAILAVLMSVTLPTTMASGRVCPPKKCDFNSLLANVYLTNATQAQRLLTDCGLTVSAVKGTTIQKVNVFDSSRPTTSNPNNDPDLGTPNRDCPGGGPGIGNGGKRSSPWPNCVSQGNLIIIQDPNKPPGLANDNQYGGCITFEFTNPVQMVDMGILDLDEQGTTVKVRNNDDA